MDMTILRTRLLLDLRHKVSAVRFRVELLAKSGGFIRERKALDFGVMGHVRCYSLSSDDARRML
jgi:hypothetical protein